MSLQWRHRLAVLAAALLAMAPMTAFGAARALASSCENWTGMQPPSPGDQSGLSGVTAAGPCNVWAVGSSLNASAEQLLTLAEHWNGAAWKVVPTPSPDANSNFLRTVAAVSGHDIWAVGESGSQSFILRWKGTTWTQVPSPSPGSDFNDLSGVTATSAGNAWAVGQFSSATEAQPLVLRWNGTTWKRAVIPRVGTGGALESVTATSASNAWAVGLASTGGSLSTLILHWNGRNWSRVASPNPQGKAEVSLNGVAATSSSNAWAVGAYQTAGGGKNLILHWNGRAWKQVASPSPGTSPVLMGVAARSGTDAWATGSYNAGGGQKTLIVHWDGRAWKQVGSPNPGTVNELAGVAAVSASNIWAVGDFGSQVMIAHCC
jgi:hypothetical protein